MSRRRQVAAPTRISRCVVCSRSCHMGVIWRGGYQRRGQACWCRWRFRRAIAPSCAGAQQVVQQCIGGLRIEKQQPSSLARWHCVLWS